MTSKRRQKGHFYMFFIPSFKFFFLSFAFFSRGRLGTWLRNCCSYMFSQKKSATLHENWDAGGCALLCQHSFFS